MGRSELIALKLFEESYKDQDEENDVRDNDLSENENFEETIEYTPAPGSDER